MNHETLMRVKSRDLHLSALADFFEKYPKDPDQIALELEAIRECLIKNPSQNCSAKEVSKAYTLVSDLMILFREM